MARYWFFQVARYEAYIELSRPSEPSLVRYSTDPPWGIQREAKGAWRLWAGPLVAQLCRRLPPPPLPEWCAELEGQTEQISAPN